MIYFDNNATTQVDPDVLQLMLPYLQNQYGNPSSAYSFGKYAAKAVDTARQQVAALLRCEPSEIIFTSCGTESDNSAIQSALLLDPDRKHLVTSKVEHSAIINHAEALARRGYEVTWLGLNPQQHTHHYVSARWTQPAVTCSPGETSTSSVWVGLDGDSNGVVEQAGSSASCINGRAFYRGIHDARAHDQRIPNPRIYESVHRLNR